MGDAAGVCRRGTPYILQSRGKLHGSLEMGCRDYDGMIVLAGKRPLAMAMVWRLHQQLGIPVESLFGRGG